MSNNENCLPFSAYLGDVQHAIKAHCSDAQWVVKAEITNRSVKGGHCNLELAEKDEMTHQLIASTIFNYSYELVESE